MDASVRVAGWAMVGFAVAFMATFTANLAMTLFVEVLNATNRRNQRARDDPPFDRFGFVREPTEDLLPIIPSAGVRFEF